LKSKIEKGVKISKNVIIEGKVFIGKGTKILVTPSLAKRQKLGLEPLLPT